MKTLRFVARVGGVRARPAGTADRTGQSTAGYRATRLAQCDDDDRRPLPAAGAAAVSGRNRLERGAVETGLAGARGSAQGRAEHPADHDRRCRLRRTEHVRRRDPDPGARPHRQ